MNTNDSSDANGVVIKINIQNIFVRTDGKVVRCSIPARIGAQHSADNGSSIIVGDVVRISEFPDGSGKILQTLPRRNALSRRSAVPMPSAHASVQLIAANLDLAVPVCAAANPTPHWRLLDRYLVLAEMLGLPALICITKGDLAQSGSGELDPELTAALAEYQRIGYPTLVTCAHNGAGLDQLRQALDGKVAVLLGKSGVGKSSLLNALQPGLGLRINDVNATTGKGRHTTSVSEMYHLDSGGAIIDTPGVREFGLWDIPVEDLALMFPEMRPLVGQCRFGLGCKHIEEPGCAVRKAVMSGQITPYRYQSYLKLIEEGGRQ